MKVLTHEGVLVTIPFTIADLQDDEFERIDGNGGAKVGIVTEMPEEAVMGLIKAPGGAEEKVFASSRQMVNDIRFIAGRLIEIPVGTEVKAENTASRFKLLIPDDAQPKKEPVKVGDRVAINEKVRQKSWLNTRGTVAKIEGDKATVELDVDDRTRVMRATGKPSPNTAKLDVGLLDRLAADK